MSIILPDGTILNNLEEQVEYNKRNIERHFEVDRILANFGIRIIGRVDTVEDIELQPIPQGGYQYGDAYAVGPEGTVYDYFIYTRAFEGAENPHWFDIGPLQIVGPQGPQGEQGPKGDTGDATKWLYVSSFEGSGTPTDEPEGTMLLVSSRDVYRSDGTKWEYCCNIRGAQGVQGLRGIQGIQGIQGQEGARGLGLCILGQLSSIDALPDPDQTRRDGAYLVSVNNVQTVYAIIGEGTEESPLTWIALGTLSNMLSPTLNNGKLYKHSVYFDFVREDGTKINCFVPLYSTNPTPYTLSDPMRFWNDNTGFLISAFKILNLSGTRMLEVTRVEWNANQGYWRSYGILYDNGAISYSNDYIYTQPITGITDKVTTV